MRSYTFDRTFITNVKETVLHEIHFYTSVYTLCVDMLPNPVFLDINSSRSRQIDTLKIFNDNVSCIHENTEYTIDFTAGENKFTMLIILKPDFPFGKPLLKIIPSIVHHWVNDNSEIINAPGYLNFSVYSDLGRVVQVIIREFQRNPPELREKVSPQCCNDLPEIKSNSIGNNTNLYHNFSTENCEDMSCITTRLHKMTTEDLNKLNNDEHFFTDFALSLPNVQILSQNVDDVILSMEELACAKSDCEALAEELMQETENKKQQLQNDQCSYKKLLEKYEKLMEKRSNQYVKRKLKEAIKDKDKESEKIAGLFLNGEVPFERFLSAYYDFRLKVHLMQAKEKELTSGSGLVKISFPENCS